MKLVLQGPGAERRLEILRRHLCTDWTLEVWEPDTGKPALAAVLAEADAMVAMNWNAAKPPAPRLRLVQLPGAGYDNIEFATLPAKATLCNVFEHEIGISEYVIAAMLHACVPFDAMNTRLRVGDWSHNGLFIADSPHGFRRELNGLTVGILGFGHIGRNVARRAAAFGMRIIVCTRTPAAAEGADGIAWTGGLERRRDLLREADFIVIACPLKPQTRGLLDAAALAEMKADAVLINVARGEIVDEQALYDALNARRIGGAYIDTWYRYPDGDATPSLPSRLPFHELDNIVMTPHASGITAGLQPRRWSRIAENLDRLARDEPLLNVVYRPGEPVPE